MDTKSIELSVNDERTGKTTNQNERNMSKKEPLIIGAGPTGTMLKEMLQARKKQLAKPLLKLEEDIVEMDEEQQELFDSATKAVTAILINVMNALQIPNYIEIDAEANDEVYHIKIIKLGSKDSAKDSNKTSPGKDTNQ
jgi:hypothetical protein